MQFPVTNLEGVGAVVAVVLLDEMVAPPGALLSQQGIEDIEAVKAGTLGNSRGTQRRRLAGRSIVQTISALVAGEIRPFQRVMNGVRVPPS